MKTIEQILIDPKGHWVGDGFPVRTLFSYNRNAELLSPFLLFDHAGPQNFEPHDGPPRGVGQHPHRGFETVTIVYDGEVSHRDNSGGGGTIRSGDVQWMTAGRGILHEEFHSPGFSKSGGPFHMVQLWVNLPARDKMTAPAYQAISCEDIPELDVNGTKIRIIAGTFGQTKGPASSFSPLNLWDVRLDADAQITLDIPAGHNAMLAVLSGQIDVQGEKIRASEVGRLSRSGDSVRISADGAAMVLVLTGEPIDEPVVGQGPFVMNSQSEIDQAMRDYRSGQFGELVG